MTPETEENDYEGWIPVEKALELLKTIKNWPLFPQTKYVELRIDTRDMHCIVFAANVDGYKEIEGADKMCHGPNRALIGGCGYNLEEIIKRNKLYG